MSIESGECLLFVYIYKLHVFLQISDTRFPALRQNKCFKTFINTSLKRLLHELA